VIEGVGDLPVTLARCCAPVRPQTIAGYVTLGRGVTVHEARCRGLARMRAAHPERVLEVNWRSDPDSQLPVEISVSAWDRHGLVRDLSDLIAAENIGIDALNSRTDKSEGIATIVVAIGVRDQPQLARLLRQLSRVSGVISARRTR
jgi:GTP pyrophosphokinase